MKSHKEFMKEVEQAISLKSRTKKSLGPESKEDFAGCVKGEQDE